MQHLCNPIPAGVGFGTTSDPTVMSAFLLARRPPQWLRVAIAGLLLAFALNSIAHLTHRHDTSASVTHLACGYCATFGGLADAPQQSLSSLDFALAHVFIAAESSADIPIRVRTSARPRAPPHS
jgi:hypothetical protein